MERFLLLIWVGLLLNSDSEGYILLDDASLRSKSLPVDFDSVFLPSLDSVEHDFEHYLILECDITLIIPLSWKRRRFTFLSSSIVTDCVPCSGVAFPDALSNSH